MVADWLLTRWQVSRGARALTRISVGYSLLIVLAVPLLLVPVGRWPDFRHPLRAVLGWEQAARHGEALLARLDHRGRTGPGSLLARNWHHAGLLAWYAEGTPVVNLFHDLNPHNFANGLSGPETWGVLVYPRASREPRLKDLTRDFDCTPIDALPVRRGESLLQVFHFYACYWRIPQS
jgi:hypothetical protein